MFSSEIKDLVESVGPVGDDEEVVVSKRKKRKNNLAPFVPISPVDGPDSVFLALKGLPKHSYDLFLEIIINMEQNTNVYTFKVLDSRKETHFRAKYLKYLKDARIIKKIPPKYRKMFPAELDLTINSVMFNPHMIKPKNTYDDMVLIWELLS